jgi:hypothetical protein
VKFFGGNKEAEKANERFGEIRDILLKSASMQSYQLKIIKEQEAERIAETCGLSSKPHDSAAFVDLALMLLCLPPELGFVVALEFSKLGHLVDFQPFGTIMVAVGRIDSLYRPIIVRKSLLDQKPQLDELLQSRQLRIERAARLLAASIFVCAKDVDDAKKMFGAMLADAVIKERVADAIRQKDSGVARSVTS